MVLTVDDQSPRLGVAGGLVAGLAGVIARVPGLQDGEADGAAEVVVLADGHAQVVGGKQLARAEEPAKSTLKFKNNSFFLIPVVFLAPVSQIRKPGYEDLLHWIKRAGQFAVLLTLHLGVVKSMLKAYVEYCTYTYRYV